MNPPKGVKCGLPSLPHIHNTPSGDRREVLHKRPNMNLWKAPMVTRRQRQTWYSTTLVIPWFLTMTLDNTIVTKSFALMYRYVPQTRLTGRRMENE